MSLWLFLLLLWWFTFITLPIVLLVNAFILRYVIFLLALALNLALTLTLTILVIGNAQWNVVDIIFLVNLRRHHLILCYSIHLHHISILWVHYTVLCVLCYVTILLLEVCLLLLVLATVVLVFNFILLLLICLRIGVLWLWILLLILLLIFVWIKMTFW